MTNIIGLAMILTVLVIKLAIKTRLLLPLLYMLTVWIFFRDWANTNDALSTGILFALVGMSALSWVITLVKHIRNGVALHD